jgi:capsular polysaccharide export protein
MPFYAGWGLTHDRLSCARRNRNLTIDELVYASLIAYPRYVSRRSGLFMEAEEAIEELLEWRREPVPRLRSWQRIFRNWGRMRERFGRSREAREIG